MGVTVLQGGMWERRECDGGAGCGTGSLLRATAAAEATGEGQAGLGSWEGSHGLYQIQWVFPGE